MWRNIFGEWIMSFKWKGHGHNLSWKFKFFFRKLLNIIIECFSMVWIPKLIVKPQARYSSTIFKVLPFLMFFFLVSRRKTTKRYYSWWTVRPNSRRGRRWRLSGRWSDSQSHSREQSSIQSEWSEMGNS